MEEKQHSRSSMFTVRDAENAIIAFCVIDLILIGLVFSHQFFLKDSNVIDSFYFIVEHIPKIIASATMLIIFGEGIDIMFRRIRETLQREKRIKEQARAEGMAEGEAKGMAAGITEGKTEVYREVAEWDSRRREAEARGEKFIEPPPTS